MSILSDAFISGLSLQGRVVHKHNNYHDIYEKLFEPYIDKPCILVELGVSHGGSLQVWRDYLGKGSMIYGLDSAAHCLYEEERIKCFEIDQSKKESVEKISKLILPMDIFIDDGSHNSEDQILTFETVFGHLKPGGLYIVEDTHTSYRELYHMGYKNPGSFMEYSKVIIDSMYRSEDKNIPVNTHITSIESITFYYTMVVIRKAK